jgi:hypothetical protein
VSVDQYEDESVWTLPSKASRVCSEVVQGREAPETLQDGLASAVEIEMLTRPG